MVNIIIKWEEVYLKCKYPQFFRKLKKMNLLIKKSLKFKLFLKQNYNKKNINLKLKNSGSEKKSLMKLYPAKKNTLIV